LFEDFHKKSNSIKKAIRIGNINNFTSYDENTLKKHSKPEYIVVPSLKFIIDIIIDGYKVLENLFNSDSSKFNFVCSHYDDK
jgi:hypothetical protein